MTALAEHDSHTAARILAAARELVLKRGLKGLTVAEIATRAHVGKGTAYLYWSTKEDLVFGLIARDFVSLVDGEIEALTADENLCRPHRFCPRLVSTAVRHPFVRAMQTGDDELLGVLAQHPRSTELLDILGPAALMYSALPVWREHRLARTDWPLDDQAYALQALIAGFLAIAEQAPAVRAVAVRAVAVDAPEKVLAAAVTALLGPEKATRADVRATVTEGLRLLRERRAAVLALITTQ